MPSGVSGVPRIVLRAEGAAALLVAVALYARLGESWWLFAILFLAPDLSFLGYLGGARTGAIVYNAGLTLVGPLLLAHSGMFLPAPGPFPLACVWGAHIS